MTDDWVEDLAENSLESDLSDPTGSEFNEDASPDSFDHWGGGELEAAYLKALSTLEAFESEMPPQPERVGRETDLPADAPLAPTNSETMENDPSETKMSSETVDTPAERHIQTESVSNYHLTNSAETRIETVSVAERPPTPRQIIEACLFVGGPALTSKRLSGILRGEFDTDYVDREIEELNRLYAAENRPYEIRMGEGGYRLTLREDFERIRHKVYGLGPREVRLSQEALEVLAVVAYHQPIQQSRVEELGKPGCGPVLRQLVRRELIAVERDPAHPRDVNYKTTSRFLSLFDIRSLDELPRLEQVAYK